MSKVDLLLQLPAGALKEVATWLAQTRERFRDRGGWVKFDYAEELARSLSVGETQALVEELRRGKETHYTLALLVRLFGLPPKEVMLDAPKEHLRELMDGLESEARVSIPWRSMTATDLRDYLSRKLSATEIARRIGLDVPLEKKPPREPGRARPGVNLQTPEQPGPTNEPPMNFEEVVPTRSINVGRIEKLEELRRYLLDDFQSELNALDDLGSNEQRFQHRIVSILESRISAEPFSLEEKFHLPELDQYPDVMIHHARGHTAFEIKPSGSLSELLADAQKLKGYLRTRNVRINCGVLVYRSPFAVADELKRAMNSKSLHIVRVTPRRR